jgi:hypothetical protein
MQSSPAPCSQIPLIYVLPLVWGPSFTFLTSLFTAIKWTSNYPTVGMSRLFQNASRLCLSLDESMTHDTTSLGQVIHSIHRDGRTHVVVLPSWQVFSACCPSGSPEPWQDNPCEDPVSQRNLWDSTFVNRCRWIRPWSSPSVQISISTVYSLHQNAFEY